MFKISSKYLDVVLKASVISACLLSERDFVSILVLQSFQCNGEERVGCFALFVFLVSRDCCVALPHHAMGLSAVCDCGIY